jgi:hypothetical protein
VSSPGGVALLSPAGPGPAGSSPGAVAAWNRSLGPEGSPFAASAAGTGFGPAQLLFGGPFAQALLGGLPGEGLALTAGPGQLHGAALSSPAAGGSGLSLSRALDGGWLLALVAFAACLLLVAAVCAHSYGCENLTRGMRVARRR